MTPAPESGLNVVAWPCGANALGCETCGVLGDLDGEVALGHRHRVDAHVLAHDDDAVLLVDDDARHDLDRARSAKLLDIGHEIDDIVLLRGRDVEDDGRGIGRLLGDVALGMSVDHLGDASSGGEIGIVQHQADAMELRELEADLALDDGAGRDGGHPVGTPLVTELAWPLATKPPAETVPWATE